ncbi:MAG: NapC/NirT family cytochrome c [Bacillota bacterium]|nr:NapC/NirT family cytochrome c [Bacillota bacterium]
MIKKVAKKIFLVFILLLSVSFISYGAFISLYFYTSTPKFCSSCHYVAPYVASWNISSHKEVNCMGCHEPIGSLGKLHSKARGLNYYISDKTGNYVLPIFDASYISEANCFRCHTGQSSAHMNAPMINDNHLHLEYIKEERKCSSCHNEVGHDINIGLDEVFK